MIAFLLSIVMGMACFTATAEEIDGRGEARLLRKEYVSTVTDEARDYFLFVPKGYDTEKGKLWPVILFLHGGGERGNGKEDLDKVLLHGPLMEAWKRGRDLPFLMISPQMPPIEQREVGPGAKKKPSKHTKHSSARIPMMREPTGVKPPWGEQGPRQGWWLYEKDILNMVDATLHDYRADPDRVYLTGLSYGGFGTWYFAAAYPYRWAAVAPICGAGDTKTVGRIAEAKLPIWIFQGGRDRTVRPEWVLETAVALEAAGHPEVRFTVHEDLAHGVWKRVYAGWDLYNWFLAHRRRTAAPAGNP